MPSNYNIKLAHEDVWTSHDIRRSLRKKIESRRGSAPVSQIYGHKSEGTYPTYYYQDHCSSNDTVDDVLDEEEEAYHIHYLRRYGQFREGGLPQQLSVEVEEAILQRKELVNLRHEGGKRRVNFYRNEYRKALISIQLSEVHQYQTQWVRNRCD
ncbi:uncharacterized protein Aud_010237 [Aspergillus udagawae]|uniref:Uncharacterized protein n=1 Tax=Aspergillus udagawae TaxID=91492 RepID=A0A8E0V5U3_9EURO|nr:uncharacterized protein Aud_010237 [Aspergillus udagawae]GIC93749.1 hypothetical protein Aud_010237 [Aspergillus udagawae]